VEHVGVGDEQLRMLAYSRPAVVAVRGARALSSAGAEGEERVAISRAHILRILGPGAVNSTRIYVSQARRLSVSPYLSAAGVSPS
jgi:hypothetical protein